MEKNNSQGDTESRRRRAGGPAFRRARVIGERLKTRNTIKCGVSLVSNLSPITQAAEGGTQPSSPWNPMAPHVEKPYDLYLELRRHG